MSKKSCLFHEPLPYYMSAIGMQGARFIEGNTGDPAPAGEPVVASDPVADPKPEPLGDAGLKALQAERDARKVAEDKVAEFEKAQAEADKAKLGEVERAQANADEAAKEAAGAKAELARYKLANKHGITDEEDLELLATAADETAMERLAVRLAKAATPGTPKPDLSGGPRNEKAGTIAEQIAAAVKAGDKDAVASLKAQQLGALASNQNKS